LTLKMNPNINCFNNNNIFFINNYLFFTTNINIINNNNNNFFVPNLMNNQFLMNPMMQINPIVMPNVNNQNNNNIFNMNQNQKLLIDKIIDFYQKSGNIYMNYDEPNQIKNLLNNLDINNPQLKEGNDIDDPLPYIDEKKVD